MRASASHPKHFSFMGLSSSVGLQTSEVTGTRQMGQVGAANSAVLLRNAHWKTSEVWSSLIGFSVRKSNKLVSRIGVKLGVRDPINRVCFIPRHTKSQACSNFIAIFGFKLTGMESVGKVLGAYPNNCRVACPRRPLPQGMRRLRVIRTDTKNLRQPDSSQAAHVY